MTAFLIGVALMFTMMTIYCLLWYATSDEEDQ